MKRDRVFVNGLMRLAAYALMALVGVSSGSAWGEGAISWHRNVNPEFIKWQRRQIPGDSQQQNIPSKRKLLSDSNTGDVELTGRAEGLEPTLIDFSYLNRINQREFGGVANDLPPKSYDPREKYTLTPVRNQDPQNTGIATCWAWASIGSMETWLAVKGYGQKQFSVKHLINFLGFDLGDDPQHPKGWFFGNAQKSSAYLLRWGGPVWEKDDPYTDKVGKLNYSLTSPSLAPVYHVQQMRMVPARTGSLDNVLLKRAIMEFGGLFATMTLNSSYFGSRGAYYCDLTGAGHAVTLIGWDDDFSIENFAPNCKPKGKGAFIVKDSYGTGYPRNNGYIYVSYYDTTFAYTPSYAFPMLESVDNYSRIYQYDELGWIGSFVNAKSVYAANIFTAAEDGELDAVGFYAVEPNERYTITVYTGCEKGKPTSKSKIVSQEGKTDAYAGYYTYKLKESVPLKKGSRFSIVMRLVTDDSGPLPVEYAKSDYSSKATAQEGQSFVSEDGKEWFDLTKVIHATANFCCKAYTKSATAAKPQLSSIRIEVPEGVGKTVKRGDKIQLKCVANYSNNKDEDVTGKASWSFTAGRDYATLSKGLLEVKKDIVIKTDSRIGIKASYKEGSITPTDAKIEFELVESAPDAPTGITATEGTKTDYVEVKWQSANRAAAYAVYRSKTESVNNAEHLTPDVTSTNFYDKAATPGVDYWYFVKAKNSIENATETSMNNVGVKGWRKLSPPDVRDEDVSKNLPDRVEVKWEASAGAKAYRVYRSDTLDGAKNPLSGWQTDTKYQDTTAVAGRTYYYYVKAAVDTNGTRPSDYSIVADGMIVPPVTVSKLTISGAATIESGKSAGYTASVEYSDQSNPKDVTVSCNWSKLGSAADWNGSTKTLTAKTVTSDQKVKLIAFYTENKTTIVCTNEVTITPGTSTPLATPSGLKVTSQTTAGIGLSWNSVTGAGSYYVYRAASGETAEKIGSKDTTSFTDNTATPGVTYTYSVSAVNSKGESARSGTVTGTVPLSAPTSVTATSDRMDGVNITWQPSVGATYYRVARATSATGAKTDLGSWTTDRTYPDTTATAGTTYYYFVRAATSSGGANASGYSDPAAQGMRVPSSGSLSSISIEGQDNVSSGQAALYTCTALYSNGESHTVKADSWSVSPTSAATIDGNGRLTAKNVTKDTDVTVSASYTEGGVMKSASKTLKVFAAASQPVQVKDVTTTSRWPFAAILDIDYTLVVNPSGGKASVSVFGRDEDRGVDVAAKTLSGDGADGSAIAAGTHRLSWDVGTDYPAYHGNAFGVTLSATPYVAQTYTVTYSPGTYGTGTQKTATKTENVALTLLGATFSRTGYTQTGWSKNSNGSSKDYSLSASYTANAPITLYPFWTANTYTIKFNANGGTGSMSDLSMTYDVAKNLTDNGFTKSGNDFAGWATNASGSVVYSNGASVKNLTATQGGTVTLYAKWTAIPTYAVTYSPGTYGTGTQQTATKTKDVVLTLKGAIFTRTGYTQTGWATSDGGTKAYDLGASYTANAPIALYPFWKRVINLTPLRNLLAGIEKLTPDSVLSDEELNKAMTNPHYANLDGDATTISSAEMSIFRRIQALNTDKTLLSNVMSGEYSGIPDATMEELGSISDAIAELTNRSYTVTYSPGTYGTGTQQTATKTKDVALTLLGATFTRTGYTQTGWATSDGGTKAYDLSASYTANAPITLYPFWTRSYNLMPLRNLLTNIEQLNPDGVLSDDELNKAMTNPHYCNMDGDSTTISSAEMSIFTRIQTLNQDKTLISNVIKGDYTGIPEATMEELQSLSDAVKELTSNGSYTVTYNPGVNGTGSQRTATKTKDVALTLLGATFTRTGYTQTGWATSDGGAKAYDLSASYTANAPITLYPFWTPSTVTPSTVTIYFDGQGTTTGATYQDFLAMLAGKSYTCSEAYGSLPVPTFDGYTFAGWWTAASGGTLVTESSIVPTTSITLYAHWNVKSYNLMPLRNLLTGIEKLNPDGVLSDDELNKAMTNPHYANLDGDATTISSAEMSIFTRIQTLNQDKTLISNVIKGDYTGIPVATMEELQSLSDAVKELTNRR